MLGQLGLDFRVVAASFEERTAGADPTAVVVANALGKAREVATRSGIPEAGAVLGADTEVVLDGVVLGKPADAAAARAMLVALGGRTHEVITGVALITRADEVTAHETTRVQLRGLGAAEIDWYVATGEWRERAGAYAIQGAGAVLVGRVEGDPSNVIGLPMARVARLLADAGLWPQPSALRGRDHHPPR
jgi:septum formation protein